MAIATMQFFGDYFELFLYDFSIMILIC